MLMRPRIDMGEVNGRTVELSVQASRYAYCEPRVDGWFLPFYLAVEVAVFWGGEWALPSDFGIEGFDKLFEPRRYAGATSVAGYMPQDTLAELKRAITERVFA